MLYTYAQMQESRRSSNVTPIKDFSPIPSADGVQKRRSRKLRKTAATTKRVKEDGDMEAAVFSRYLDGKNVGSTPMTER